MPALSGAGIEAGAQRWREAAGCARRSLRSRRGRRYRMSLDVGRLVLVRGTNHPGSGFSTMEAVSFAADEAWSERPRCASPTITEWMIAWNDGLDDGDRQNLRRYIWRLVGSRGTPAQERVRRWMVADWLVRSYAPAWLAAAGLRGQA